MVVTGYVARVVSEQFNPFPISPPAQIFLIFLLFILLASIFISLRIRLNTCFLATSSNSLVASCISLGKMSDSRILSVSLLTVFLHSLILETKSSYRLLTAFATWLIRCLTNRIPSYVRWPKTV